MPPHNRGLASGRTLPPPSALLSSPLASLSTAASLPFLYSRTTRTAHHLLYHLTTIYHATRGRWREYTAAATTIASLWPCHSFMLPLLSQLPFHLHTVFWVGLDATWGRPPPSLPGGDISIRLHYSNAGTAGQGMDNQRIMRSSSTHCLSLYMPSHTPHAATASRSLPSGHSRQQTAGDRANTSDSPPPFILALPLYALAGRGRGWRMGGLPCYLPSSRAYLRCHSACLPSPLPHSLRPLPVPHRAHWLLTISTSLLTFRLARFALCHLLPSLPLLPCPPGRLGGRKQEAGGRVAASIPVLCQLRLSFLSSFSAHCLPSCLYTPSASYHLYPAL